MPGKLYLIPSLLGENDPAHVLPSSIGTVIRQLNTFIVEDIRSARRFIKKVYKDADIDKMHFLLLNEHTTQKETEALIDPMMKGTDTGLISEAGVPGVADPGAGVVMLAHNNSIQVVPLVGPSSILLAMMASGMNGQNFAFNGYLPVEKSERIKKIKFFEKRSETENQSQVFIETPYRNNHLLADIVSTCNNETYLCLATNISLSDETILTKKISDWKKGLPDLNKKPSIFIIHKLCFK